MRIQQIVEQLSRVNVSEEEFSRIHSRITDADWPAIVREFDVHKTLYQFVLHACQHIPNQSWQQSILPHLQVLGERRMRRYGMDRAYRGSYIDFRDHLERRIRECIAEAVRLVAGYPDVVLLKGTALRAYLPSYRRFQIDVDLYVGSRDSAVQLLRQLTAEGYTLLGKATQGDSRTPFLCGQLLKPGVNIGIHAQIFPMGSCRFPFPLKVDILGRSQIVNTPEGMLRVPSQEDMLVMHVAHLAKHGYMLRRDVNDMLMMLTQFKLDWPYIDEVLRSNSLKTAFDAVVSDAATIYDISAPAAASKAATAMRYLLRRGCRKGITGSLLVNMLSTFWLARASGSYGLALVDLGRLGTDSVICKLFSRQSHLRERADRLWEKCLPGCPRARVHANLAEAIRSYEAC